MLTRRARVQTRGAPLPGGDGSYKKAPEESNRNAPCLNRRRCNALAPGTYGRIRPLIAMLAAGRVACIWWKKHEL